jgi:hypothetical protein
MIYHGGALGWAGLRVWASPETRQQQFVLCRAFFLHHALAKNYKLDYHLPTHDSITYQYDNIGRLISKHAVDTSF